MGHVTALPNPLAASGKGNNFAAREKRTKEETDAVPHHYYCSARRSAVNMHVHIRKLTVYIKTAYGLTQHVINVPENLT